MFCLVNFVQLKIQKTVPASFIQNYKKDGKPLDLKKTHKVFFTKNSDEQQAYNDFLLKAIYNPELMKCVDDKKMNKSKQDGFYYAMIACMKDTREEIEAFSKESGRPRRLALPPQKLREPAEEAKENNPKSKSNKLKKELKRTVNSNLSEAANIYLNMATKKSFDLFEDNENDVSGHDSETLEDIISKHGSDDGMNSQKGSGNESGSDGSDSERAEKIYERSPRHSRKRKHSPHPEKRDKENVASSTAEKSNERLRKESKDMKRRESSKEHHHSRSKEKSQHKKREDTHKSDIHVLYNNFTLTYVQWVSCNKPQKDVRGDSKFVGNLAHALCGDALKEMSLTGDAKNATKQNKKFDPAILDCIKIELRNRILKERPVPDDDTILDRVGKVEKYLTSKIQNLNRKKTD